MIKKNILALSLLLIPGIITAKTIYTSKNTALYRPFASSIYDLMGSKYEVALAEPNHKHRMYFNAIFDYKQNLNGSCNNGFNALAFWSGTNTLTIGNNDGKADIDGYNLGLGYNLDVDEDGIAGKIQLNNKVRQMGTDLKLYYAHYKDASGFFVKFHAPLVVLTVNSNLTESPLNTDTDFNQTQTTNPGGTVINYSNPNYLLPADRYVSASQFFLGGTNDCTSMNGAVNKPIKLNKGHVATHFTVTRIADLSGTIGYNYITMKDDLLAIGFKVTCPTGNIPTAYSIAEPIAGRAGCWGVGGEITGSYKIWNNNSNEKSLYINMQGEALHLLPNRTPYFRSFDLLKNGPGSKYLLVQRYAADSFINSSPAYVQQIFPQKITPAINITTLPIFSKISIEGSFATQLKYFHNNWSCSLNGEIFGRSQEKITIDTDAVVAFSIDSLNNYAVIGRQVGKYNINFNTPASTQELTSNLCEPLATINESQNPVILSGSVNPLSVPTPLPTGIADGSISTNRIPAKFSEALDICGAQVPSVISGTILLSADYTWKDKAYLPSISIFGGAELTSNNSLPQFWTAGINGNIQF